MLEEGTKNEEFNGKFDRFQGFLIKKMEEGRFYKDDYDRHMKEADMAKEYGEVFRKLAEGNTEIHSAILSEDFEKAAGMVMEKLNIGVAA